MKTVEQRTNDVIEKLIRLGNRHLRGDAPCTAWREAVDELRHLQAIQVSEVPVPSNVYLVTSGGAVLGVYTRREDAVARAERPDANALIWAARLEAGFIP